MSKPSKPGQSGQPRRQLNLFDTINIIIGVIIGSGIYETTPDIASNTSSSTELIGVWIFGGVIALIAAFCYVELTTSFPREGGDYVFLSKGLGRHFGFLFSWAEFWIIRPGNIGMMAFVFARFAREIVPLDVPAPWRNVEMIAYGCGATVVLTALNLLGVTSGKTTQNVLNVAKLVGLLAIILTAFFLLPAAAPPAESASAEPSEATTETAADKGPADPAAADSSDQAKGDTSSESSKSVRLAILLVLFSYGGWNEVSCVAAEVRDPQKNIFRALAFGVFAVAAVYVLVNFAFLRALGLAGVAGSEAVAADVMALRFGDVGRVGISILICASSLGAMNGALMAGSRILFAVGRDHKQLSWLGGWSGRFDAPIAALVLQTLMILALIIGFGRYDDGFQNLFDFTTPVYWCFATLVAISLFLLRRQKPDVDKPYRVIGYPVTPIVFVGLCLFLSYSSITYARDNFSVEAYWSAGILLLGAFATLIVSFGRSDEKPDK